MMVFWMCTGDCSNPAYLANVCVAAAAQRQGIGRRLIESAHSLAVNWGMMNLSSKHDKASPRHYIYHFSFKANYVLLHPSNSQLKCTAGIFYICVMRCRY